jgi:hypothetical protein
MGEPGCAVEKAQLQHIEAQEPRKRGARHRDRRTAPAAGMHRVRLQRRIPVLLGDVAFQRFRRRVQQVAIQPADRTIGDHVLVHRIVAPARAPAIEKARRPVGIAFTMRKPASEKAIATRQRIGRVRRRTGREQRDDRLPKRRRKPLVGIEAQHPVVHRFLDCELLLPAEAEKGVREHPRAGAPRGFYGMIAAPRIDDERVTAERRGQQAFADVGCGIARDHDQRNGKRLAHARFESADAILRGDPSLLGLLEMARFYVV